MALETVMKKLGDGLRGKDILHHVPLPSIAVVSDLEVADELKRRHPVSELITIYWPDYFEQHPLRLREFKVHGRVVEGEFLSGTRVRYALPVVYEKSGHEDPVKEDLHSLEAAVAEENARRTANEEQLSRLGQQFVRDGAHSPDQVKALIYQLLTNQFEFPEHLIRENIQNAAAAAPDPETGRIDVYLDPKARLIRVDDNGVGMTQDVMSNVYFNLFASLNEALKHAEGKFGIGAISNFGVGHEYVKVDSVPANGGLGGMAIVNADLQRDDFFLPNERTTPGTTIEIKLSERSDIDFGRLIEILKEDCCYIETPTYLHVGGSAEKINKPLLQPGTPDTVTFEDELVQGHLTKAGVGAVKLLSHRIKLASVDSIGYKGAVNCDKFGKTIARDTILDDPVLRYVLAYVRNKGRELLQGGEVNIKNFSLEARLAAYKRFVCNSILNEDGSPNETWIMQNLDELIEASEGIKTPLKKAVLDLGYKSAAFAVAGSAIITGAITAPAILPHFIEYLPAGIAVLGSIAFIAESMAVIAMSETALRYAFYKASDKLGQNVVGYHLKHLNKKSAGNHGGFNAVAKDSVLPAYVLRLSAMLVAGSAMLYGAGRALSQSGVRSFFGVDMGATDVSALSSEAVTASQEAATGGMAAAIANMVPAMLPYIGAAAAVGGAAYVVHRMRKNVKFKPFTGPLDEGQERLLEGVRDEVRKFGLGEDVSVHFSKRLREGQESFAVRKGQIVLNRHQPFPAWAPALSYSAEVVKDERMARQITDAYLVAK